MAINKNHEFEELNGVKCGIVEKYVSPERLTFIKSLLENNGFTVIAVPSPAPKTVPPSKTTEEAITPIPGETVVEKTETFTVGVTDYTFNTTNAIFGRLLKTKDGHIVTLAYWQQRDAISHDEIPYYEEL